MDDGSSSQTDTRNFEAAQAAAIHGCPGGKIFESWSHAFLHDFSSGNSGTSVAAEFSLVSQSQLSLLPIHRNFTAPDTTSGLNFGSVDSYDAGRAQVGWQRSVTAAQAPHQSQAQQYVKPAVYIRIPHGKRHLDRTYDSSSESQSTHDLGQQCFAHKPERIAPAALAAAPCPAHIPSLQYYCMHPNLNGAAPISTEAVAAEGTAFWTPAVHTIRSQTNQTLIHMHRLHHHELLSAPVEQEAVVNPSAVGTQRMHVQVSRFGDPAHSEPSTAWPRSASAPELSNSGASTPSVIMSASTLPDPLDPQAGSSSSTPTLRSAGATRSPDPRLSETFALDGIEKKLARQLKHRRVETSRRQRIKTHFNDLKELILTADPQLLHTSGAQSAGALGLAPAMAMHMAPDRNMTIYQEDVLVAAIRLIRKYMSIMARLRSTQGAPGHPHAVYDVWS